MKSRNRRGKGRGKEIVRKGVLDEEYWFLIAAPLSYRPDLRLYPFPSTFHRFSWAHQRKQDAKKSDWRRWKGHGGHGQESQGTRIVSSVEISSLASYLVVHAPMSLISNSFLTFLNTYPLVRRNELENRDISTASAKKIPCSYENKCIYKI